MEAIFGLFAIMAIAIVAANVYFTVGRDVPWYLKSKERLIHEQTQLIRQMGNQGNQGNQGYDRGRGKQGRSRSSQNQIRQIRVASAAEIQRHAESEGGYIPGYEEGAR